MAKVNDMRRVRKLITNKMRESAGESLAEVLIALLIAALALTMLASVISSASKIITNSKTAVAEYYDANNRLAEHSAGNGVSVTSKTIKIVDEKNSPVYLNTSALAEGYSVDCYSNQNSGKTPVISYGVS